VTGAITDAPRRSRRRLLAALIAGSIAPAVTACGVIFGPPPRQFTLTAVTDFPQGLPPVKWSLVVDEPTAARQIDTSRIVLMSGPFRVEYYADVEWTDSAPTMLQALLIQSFQNTRQLSIVSPTRQTLATDYLLLSDLRKFQVEQDSAGIPQANVELEVTLLRMPRRNPVATARFAKATPVGSPSTETVTTAFDTSLGEVMRRVVDWTVQQGNTAAATS
jgi:cholesterol transport system auxiliary component